MLTIETIKWELIKSCFENIEDARLFVKMAIDDYWVYLKSEEAGVSPWYYTWDGIDYDLTKLDAMPIIQEVDLIDVTGFEDYE